MEGPQHLIEPFWFHFLNPRVGLIGDAEAQQVGMPQVGELLDRLELAIDHFGLERLHSAMAGPAIVLRPDDGSVIGRILGLRVYCGKTGC